jgi:hypothetical protein
MMLLTVALLAPPLIFILLARRGRVLFIRRIPGIDAIEEAIGRATELGRPMVFTTGMTGLDSLLYALLGIIGHVGRKAAAYGCRLILPQRDYEVMPVVSETVREAFRSAGRLDAFNPQDVRYLSPEQFAFASGYMGIVHREQAASCFLFGEFAAESLVLAEAGQQVGAMQVAGTISNNQVPFFLTSCDYTLIGEEVYAAGAYLSREPAQLGSVRGQDVAKLVILALILFGVGAATVLSAGRGDPREGQQFTSWFARALYRNPEQRRALAGFEVTNTYQPPEAPERKPLEDELRRSREKLEARAGEARALLERAGRQAGALAADLHASAAVLPEGVPRKEGEDLAALLEAAAERCASEAAALRKLCAEELPALERALPGLAGVRAAQAARPELAVLADWVADLPADFPAADAVACRDALDGARRAADAGAPSAAAVNRVLERARRACHGTYFAAARRLMDRAAGAEKLKAPLYLGDVSGDGVGLLLDGTKSVSGRLLPLAYEWTVSPAPGKNGRGTFAGPRPAVTFSAPGRYRVGLKVSEVPAGPKPLVLALLTREPTSVRHERLAAGTALAMSWRLPRDVDPATTRITWDFGDGSERVEGRGGQKLDGITHRYDRPGRYPMTVEVAYARKIREVAGPAGAASAATLTADRRLAALRLRVGDGLSAVCDQLSALEEHLDALGTEAKGSAGQLAEIKGASEPSWPDRALAEGLAKRVGELKSWEADELRLLGKAMGAAGRLGETAPAPDVTPAGAGAAEQERTEQCWNRFRIYWTVVEPAEHRAEMAIEVGPADRLPRPPWEPRPAAKPEAEKAPGGGGGK